MAVLVLFDFEHIQQQQQQMAIRTNHNQMLDTIVLLVLLSM